MNEFNINRFLDFLSKNKIPHKYEIVEDDLSVIIPLSETENIQVEFFDIYFEIWFPKCYYSRTYEGVGFDTICNLIKQIYHKKDIFYEEEYFSNKCLKVDIYISDFMKIEGYRIPFYSILKKLLSNLTYKKFTLQKLLALDK